MIPAGQALNLGLRTALGATNIMIQFSITKYFKLTYISTAFNLSPLITCVMSYFILKEKISRVDIGLIVCALIGVLIMSKGFDSESESKSASAND